MAEEFAEQIKMRRWAIEQLAGGASVDTTAGIALLCRASDALIHYVNTGKHPWITDGIGNGHRAEDTSE